MLFSIYLFHIFYDIEVKPKKEEKKYPKTTKPGQKTKKKKKTPNNPDPLLIDLLILLKWLE